MKDLATKVYAEATAEVSNVNTAVAVGSGSLDVFGTPCMIALMEKATVNAIASFLENDETTVGTKIDVSHCKASGVGAVITAKAELREANGRKLVFDVIAYDFSDHALSCNSYEELDLLGVLLDVYTVFEGEEELFSV